MESRVTTPLKIPFLSVTGSIFKLFTSILSTASPRRMLPGTVSTDVDMISYRHPAFPLKVPSNENSGEHHGKASQIIGRNIYKGQIHQSGAGQVNAFQAEG